MIKLFLVKIIFTALFKTNILWNQLKTFGSLYIEISLYFQKVIDIKYNWLLTYQLSFINLFSVSF